MAVQYGGTRSTLNPNAPLFIPAAFREVEDFSPEWWDLVKTSTWFREYWFQQHQEHQAFEGLREGEDDDDDVTNLLSDSFDLGVDDQLSHLAEIDDAVFHQAFLAVDDSDSAPPPHKDGSSSSGITSDNLSKSLNLRSPKSCAVGNPDPAKYWDKPVQVIGPSHSPRCIIQQPR